MPHANDQFGDITLRDYQSSIRKQVGPWDVRGQLVVAPTGSGKTPTGIACASDFLDADKNNRVIWTAMRRELLGQAARMATRMGQDMSKYQFVSMFNREWAPLLNKRHNYMLVIDEAHHGACDTAVYVKNTISPDVMLGMSATPARADHHALGFNRTILESDYDSLISRGYLSQYEHYTVSSFDPAVVSKLFVDERERWGKSVLFFSTTDECRQFIALLPPEMAKRVGLVTSDGHRDSYIKRFAEDDGIDALVNVNILTEGYDEDSLETVFVRRTDSRTVTTQAAGRVMRIFGDTVKKVVQPVNSSMFYDVAIPAVSFDQFQGGWIRTDSDPNAIMNSMVDTSDFLIALDQLGDNDKFMKSLFA